MREPRNDSQKRNNRNGKGKIKMRKGENSEEHWRKKVSFFPWVKSAFDEQV